ncbi:LytR/AlgR family response regulator transcription factor [Larkinella sp. VNQ87]|uniref:LytR/AlgR family response regulator transcription factor n=1 Tax=Larkinella sp. VNQ87 TaxID=3400921 RepID=UPI003C10DE3C
MIQILIVEDEPLAVRKLVTLLAQLKTASQVVSVTDGIESTVNWLRTNPSPDLVLMDIELSDGQSFEIFQQVSIECPVVFTTSYDEFAVRSFQSNRFTYLLKPIKKDELERVLASLPDHNLPTITSTDIGELVEDLRKKSRKPEFRSQFLARQQQQLVSVDAADIRFFYAKEGVTYLYGRDRNRYIVDYSLDVLEESLEPQRFFRINDQFIVEIGAVSQIHAYLNGQLKLDLDSGGLVHDILVSRDRTRAFKAWIGR